MRKSKFIKLENKSFEWSRINAHLYSGVNSKNIFVGVYEYKYYFIVFDYFFHKNRLIKHISISHKNLVDISINRVGIDRIIKNFIGEKYILDEQVITNKVLNIYEKA